jgi:hypothetical protein
MQAALVAHAWLMSGPVILSFPIWAQNQGAAWKIFFCPTVIPNTIPSKISGV